MSTTIAKTKHPEHVIALAKRLYVAFLGTTMLRTPWDLMADEMQERWCQVALASIEERRVTTSRHAIQLVRDWESCRSAVEDYGDARGAARTADAMAIELENLATLVDTWRRRAVRHGYRDAEDISGAPSEFVVHDG